MFSPLLTTSNWPARLCEKFQIFVVTVVALIFKQDFCGLFSQMFTMLLYHRGTSITYVVPNKRHGLTAILETMKHKQNLLFAARAEAKYEIIKITIPKMKIKNSIYWNDAFLEVCQICFCLNYLF